MKLSTLRHGLEYALVRVVLFFIDLFPLKISTWMVERWAEIWFLVDRSRREVAKENIMRADITIDPVEVLKIARASFRHFGVLVLESLKSGQTFTEENWRDKVELDIHPETQKLLDKPHQGILLISGHIGNWEIAAQLLSFIKPVNGVTRPMNNPYVERLVLKRKPKNQFKVTPKYDANALRFLSLLKKGEVLALLTDQHARSHGVMVDFFGIPASTHSTPAMLHLVTRVPICLGFCIRKGPMDYLFKAVEPLQVKSTGDRDRDVKTILEKINQTLEEVIRAYPEQYLWAIAAGGRKRLSGRF